ncbi:MAG: dihydrofolate reductase [Saprospiraceae bacterium]
MKIAAIVAMTPNRVIGADNQIPWYLPADLKYFKKVTSGHPIIMGRKCFESIGRPLPKRTNIVLSKNPFFIASGIVRALSPEDALLDAQVAAKEANTDTIFIIGGAEIYKLFWEQTEILYLTEVHTDAEGDVYFPELNENEWKLVSSEHKEADEKNIFAATYKVYERKS